MDLSIIIVNWNTCDLLRQCLKSVYDTVHGLSFEVIVVDNGSSDGSVEMVRREFPQVVLIENRENLGFARANNQAIHISRGDLALFLNSDAFLRTDAVQQLVRTMRDHPDVGIAGPALFFPDGRVQASHSPLPSLRSETMSLLGLDRLPRRIAVVDSKCGYFETGGVSGACFVSRRQVFDEIGLFDEGFFMFSEEIDLCYRAWIAGWKVVHVPTAHVYHVGGGSTGTTAKRLLMLYRSKLRYFSKHFGAAAERALLIAMRVTILSKMCLYTTLSWLGMVDANRVALWRMVSKHRATLRI